MDDPTGELANLVKLEDWKRIVELASLGDEADVRKTLVVGHRLFVYYAKNGNPTIAVTTGRPGTFRNLFRTFRVSVRGVLELVALEGKVYFQEGPALWVTDGTESGTRLVKDVLPGSGVDKVLLFLTVLGDRLYFSADDGVHGREPWKLHRGGTPALLMDIAPGTASSSPRGFIRSDDDIFFAAADGRRGEELWATPKEHRDCGR